MHGPRERLFEQGTRALSDEELIAILLGSGTKATPVAVLAARLLSETGGLAAMERAGIGELVRVPGIGRPKASRLLAAIEIGRRVITTPLSPGAPITSSSAVDAALRPWLAHACQEHFVAIALDVRHRVLGQAVVGVGGLTVCPVSPSDLFRQLLRHSAAATVLVHNHPSGDPAPSEEDRLLTRRLVEAGKLLDIPVVDHVIIARSGYFSFLDEGLVPQNLCPSSDRLAKRR